VTAGRLMIRFEPQIKDRLWSTITQRLKIKRRYEERGGYENETSQIAPGLCACAGSLCRHGSAGADQRDLPEPRAAPDRAECAGRGVRFPRAHHPPPFGRQRRAT